MAEFSETRTISEVVSTVETAISDINTALASITSARNTLNSLETTYPSLSDNSLFDTVNTGAVALVEEVDSLFNDDISTAPQIDE